MVLIISLTYCMCHKYLICIWFVFQFLIPLCTGSSRQKGEEDCESPVTQIFVHSQAALKQGCESNFA